MYIADPERKEWLQDAHGVRPQLPGPRRGEPRRILEKLVAAESFERFLHAKYIGHKRFSLEGGEAPDPPPRPDPERRRDAGGVREVVMGMSHRGRLNVLANTMGKPLAQIFSEFEGNVDPDSDPGLGRREVPPRARRATHTADTGERSRPSAWRPNPSHLEWVDPVVEGMVAGQAGRHRGPASAPRCCPC